MFRLALVPQRLSTTHRHSCVRACLCGGHSCVCACYCNAHSCVHPYLCGGHSCRTCSGVYIPVSHDKGLHRVTAQAEDGRLLMVEHLVMEGQIVFVFPLTFEVTRERT